MSLLSLSIALLTVSAHAAEPEMATCDSLLRSGSQIRLKALKYSERKALAWKEKHNCVSCHTVLPALLSAETPPPEILSGIQDRLSNWGGVTLWYPDQAAASRATELILNLTALSKAGLPLPERFLKELADTQDAQGAWPWLDFDLQPWESVRGRVFGAALVASFLSRAQIVNAPANAGLVAGLRKYLRNMGAQPSANLLEKITALWGSAEIGGAIWKPRQQELITELLSAQRRDGGWSMNRLGDWKKKGKREVAKASSADGYATAFSLFAIARWAASENLGELPRAQRTRIMEAYTRGVRWLGRNQLSSGSWASASVNSDNKFNHGLMEDAAAGYGALVLSTDPFASIR